MENHIEKIRQAIRDIPNFPKPGVVFKDITPLLSNGPLYKQTIDLLTDRYRSQSVDIVLGIESRGFIIGSTLAYTLGAGFCIVRKPGKLPYETHSASYELEYGSDTLEVHRDAIQLMISSLREELRQLQLSWFQNWERRSWSVPSSSSSHF